MRYQVIWLAYGQESNSLLRSEHAARHPPIQLFELKTKKTQVRWTPITLPLSPMNKLYDFSRRKRFGRRPIIYRTYDPDPFQIKRGCCKTSPASNSPLMRGTIRPESELNVAEGDLTTEFLAQSFSDGVLVHGVQMNGDHAAQIRLTIHEGDLGSGIV